MNLHVFFYLIEAHVGAVGAWPLGEAGALDLSIF